MDSGGERNSSWLYTHPLRWYVHIKL
uniref:Uncharacterized protein n=1 Tax=Arundo donax TaxID=35708 RepID=A0A0A8YK15_ARUDO